MMTNWPLVPTCRDIWPQFLSTFIIVSAVAQLGICLAFSGVLIPQLADDPNIDGFDKTAASWIAGLFAIAEIAGALSGKIMDEIGRKKCFLLSQFPVVISWWILAFTHCSIWPIYLARMLSGYGSGIMCTVVYVYISEISHVSYRGVLSVMTSVMASFGMLLATVLGVTVNWHYMSIIFGVLSLASFIMSFLLPESPHWLMSMAHRSPEKVMKHLRYLNRPDWLFREAWDRLIQVNARNEDAPETTNSLAFQLKQRTSYKPLMLLTILFVLQQFTGTYLVIFYSVNLFTSVGKNLQGFTVDEAVMAMGGLRLLITILSVIASKYLSKNQIMIISGILTSLSAASVSICLRLSNVRTVEFQSVSSSEASTVSSAASTAASVLLLLFLACGSFGIMIIPWTLPSDLLSTSMRGVGNVYSFVLSNLLVFAIVKLFPLSLDYLSLPVVFAIFAAFSVAFTLFVWLCVPDTSDKNFDVAKYFDKGTRRK